MEVNPGSNFVLQLRAGDPLGMGVLHPDWISPTFWLRSHTERSSPISVRSRTYAANLHSSHPHSRGAPMGLLHQPKPCLRSGEIEIDRQLSLA